MSHEEKNKRVCDILKHFSIIAIIIIIYTIFYACYKGYCANSTAWKIRGRIMGSNGRLLILDPSMSDAIEGDSLSRDPYDNQGSRSITWYVTGSPKRYHYDGSTWIDTTPSNVSSSDVLQLSWNRGNGESSNYGFVNFGTDVHWMVGWRSYVNTITASTPNVSAPIIYDHTIKQYIAVAASVNNGIVLDFDEGGTPADHIKVSISGKRPTRQYLETVETAINGVSIGAVHPAINWSYEAIGSSAYPVINIVKRFSLNGLSVFAYNQGITPSYGESYFITFDLPITSYEDGYAILQPSIDDWTSANDSAGGLYQPTGDKKLMYYGLSTIDTVSITPVVGNSHGATSYTKFDNKGTLLTSYSVNGLLEDVSRETLDDTYQSAANETIEKLREENERLQEMYNQNMQEYITSQLDFDDDTGIAGGFQSIVSNMGSLVSGVGDFGRVVVLSLGALPSGVLVIISFTITAICIIGIFKALRG